MMFKEFFSHEGTKARREARFSSFVPSCLRVRLFPPLLLLALIFLLPGSPLAADPVSKATPAPRPGSRPPLEVMKEDGYLALFDNASYFVFEKNGVFASIPVGISGRTFEGTWKSAGNSSDSSVRITASAKLGWNNGMIPMPPPRYQIVFVIYSGYSAPRTNQGCEPVVRLPLANLNDATSISIDNFSLSKSKTIEMSKPEFLRIEKIFNGYYLIEEMREIQP